MCDCLDKLHKEITNRFGGRDYRLGCLTASLPESGKGINTRFNRRLLLRVKYADCKYMNVPAIYCPFCGEKYNKEEPSGVAQSISYVQKKKGDEITRLPK